MPADPPVGPAFLQRLDEFRTAAIAAGAYDPATGEFTGGGGGGLARFVEGNGSPVGAVDKPEGWFYADKENGGLYASAIFAWQSDHPYQPAEIAREGETDYLALKLTTGEKPSESPEAWEAIVGEAHGTRNWVALGGSGSGNGLGLSTIGGTTALYAPQELLLSLLKNNAVSILLNASGGTPQLSLRVNGHTWKFDAEGRLEPPSGVLANSVVIGPGAGAAAPVGEAEGNTYIGVRAGATNTSGENVCIGHFAGAESDYGGGQMGLTAVGWGAGENAKGESCTYVGAKSGQVDTGWQNTFIGEEAGVAHETGDKNTFVGMGAGAFNATGAANVIVGHQAGSHGAGTGDDNVLIGLESGYNANGSRNATLGALTLHALKNGDDNVAIGSGAGASFTKGSGNVLIGKGAGDELVGTVNNTLVIGTDIEGEGESRLIQGDFTRGAQKLAFFGQAPVARPELPLAGATTDQIVGALNGLGLVLGA